LKKVGEMVALTLELALKDRYGHRIKKTARGEMRFRRNASLRALKIR
jgi:hypothetical protein